MILSKEEILHNIMDKKNNFWSVKFVHSSGHGGQHKDHGNSKAQLFFDVTKFFEDFDKDNTKWDKFVQVFGKHNIHHDGSVVILENQEQRSAKANEENVLIHLRHLLSSVLEDDVDRIETEVPHIEKEKRLEEKKHHWKKKKHRAKNDIE